MSYVLSQNIRQIDTQKDSKMGTKKIHDTFTIPTIFNNCNRSIDAKNISDLSVTQGVTTVSK